MAKLGSDCGGDSSESASGSYGFFVHDHKPCKGNSSSFDSIPDTKWWLNHHGLGTGGEKNQLVDGYYYTCAKRKAAFCRDVPLKLSHSRCHNSGDIWFEEFGSTINDDLLSDVLMMGLGPCDCALFEWPKKICSELDPQWIGLNKIEPWWHAVDKGDFEKVLDGGGNCFDRFEEQTKGKEKKVLHVTDCEKTPGKRGLMDCILPELNETSSCRDESNASKLDPPNTHELSSDLTRARLLEALCHSQTRAREAEKLAQNACDEKNHIIDLFFQQASCLFAYRLWLRLLKLETMCLQCKSKNQGASRAFLSRAQIKGIMLRRNRLRAPNMKRGKSRCYYVSKCVIAFAVGFGLASAGLLVGWTIGLLFPAW